MLFAQIIIFLLIISPPISLYSMDAPDATNELQQLIQIHAAMQQKIQELEEQKRQQENILEDKRIEFLNAVRQNKKLRKQLTQWAESGMWALLTHGLDGIATKAYLQILPPAENPSDDRKFIDSSFFVAKSLILQPHLLRALYYNLNKTRKKTAILRDMKTPEQKKSDWYVPGLCRLYSDVFFKRNFGGSDYKDDSLVTDIGARAIVFTVGTMLLPVAIASDSAKVIGNCYSNAKNYFTSEGTFND